MRRSRLTFRFEPGNEESGLSESHFSSIKAFASGSSMHLAVPVVFIVDVACLGVNIPHLALDLFLTYFCLYFVLGQTESS